MRKNMLCILLLAILSLYCGFSASGDDYVDLNQRFDHIHTYEYDGTTYYMKDRVSTTLVMCVNPSDASDGDIGNIELMVLLVIDDDMRTARPVQIDPGMTTGWIEGGMTTLEDIFSSAADIDTGCIELVNTINAAFPQAVCDHYAVLDLNGLPVLDNIQNDGENTTGDALIGRLKAIKADAEQAGSDVLTDYLDSLSGYIITDMKSGAMMKVVDKVERFERYSRVHFPTLVNEDPDEPMMPDKAAFEIMMLDLYFEDERSW